MELNFITPPENGGQIVEVSYARTDDGHVIECHYDQSDGKMTYYISVVLQDDDGDYWNGSPRNKRWRKMTPRQLEFYGLDEASEQDDEDESY